MQTILLVEDDFALATGLRYTFEEEYHVIHAYDAAEARKAFMEGGFDLVILDVMLPDGDGYTLCTELRKNSQIPVIFLTALDEEVNVVHGLDMGGDDYVTKPFRLKELLSRVKAQLRRTAAGDALLSTGDIIIHPTQYSATCNGKDLLLTLTEFRLLTVLLKHQGQILTRKQLLDILWDHQGEFVDDNTLSVHVRHVRKKLSDANSKVEIITVRGMGYRLEVL